MTNPNDTALDREKLKELCAKATPGPWRHALEEGEGTVIAHETPAGQYMVADAGTTDEGEFIAASRTALPQLLEENERLEAELAEARRENVCDVCAGKGNPGTGKPCVCGGTGKASRQAQGFRESINDLHKLIETAERERDQARERCETLAEALRLLAREAQGFLGMASDETHGVTNKRVLQLRINEADAALAEGQEVKP